MSALRSSLIVLAVATLALGGAVADHCAGPSTTTPILTLHWLGGNGLYVTGDVFCAAADVLMCGYYVYEEANGIAGLQRGDELVDDTCHGSIAPDRIVV